MVENKLVKDVMSEFLVPFVFAASVLGLVLFWPFNL